MKHGLISKCLTAFLVVGIFGATVPAQKQQDARLATSQATGKVAEIETYVKDVDQFVKANEKAARIFADVASGTEEGPAKWQEFKTEKERETADTGDNLNENSYIWTRDGKIIGANFTFQSPSRDWVHYVMYYFRSDGTLAKSDSTLNTFLGDVTVVRQDYYNSKGVLLKGTSHCKDLKTQKRKPCGSFQDQPAPVFQHVNKLPFYGLVRK